MDDPNAAQSIWDIENLWYQEAPPSRLTKALAQYEVARSAVGVPGDFAEFGVFKATSFIRLATYRDVLDPGGARTLYGFDAFGAYPEPARADDAEYITEFEAWAGLGLSEAETRRLLDRKGFRNVELIAGDVRRTLPAFLAEHPDVRFALVHVDVNAEDATREILERCLDRISPGGAFMLDDYGKVDGATNAIDEFAAVQRGLTLEEPRAENGPWALRVPSEG